jgi:hypothetical protein
MIYHLLSTSPSFAIKDLLLFAIFDKSLAILILLNHSHIFSAHGFTLYARYASQHEYD